MSDGTRNDVQALTETDGNRLFLGIVVEYRFTHLAAPAGLLVAAERQGRVEDVVAVDPHGSGLQPGGEFMRLADIVGPDAGGETIDRVVGLFHQFVVHFLERHGGNDRSEDLFINDAHAGPGVGQHRRFDKVTAAFALPATGQRLGTLLVAGLQVLVDA